MDRSDKPKGSPNEIDAQLRKDERRLLRGGMLW